LRFVQLSNKAYDDDDDDASVERRRCSNAAKTRNPLKFARVPQTTGPISAGAPKFMGTCGGDIAA